MQILSKDRDVFFCSLYCLCFKHFHLLTGLVHCLLIILVAFLPSKGLLMFGDLFLKSKVLNTPS